VSLRGARRSSESGDGRRGNLIVTLFLRDASSDFRNFEGVGRSLVEAAGRRRVAEWGISGFRFLALHWIPAFAGMTKEPRA
jgi:hypothetical protein